MLDAFAGHELEPIVVIAIAAGLRRSELAALTWTDVDFGEGTVRIWRGMHRSGGQTYFEDPKSATSRRTVALPDWALEMLRPLRGVGPLVARDGAAMDPTSISKGFTAHMAASELPAVPLRDLRHSHATLALAAGVDPASVALRLGHSTIAVTYDYYLRPGAAGDRDTADKIESLRTRPA